MLRKISELRRYIGGLKGRIAGVPEELERKWGEGLKRRYIHTVQGGWLLKKGVSNGCGVRVMVSSTTKLK